MNNPIEQSISYLLAQICKAHRGCAEEQLNTIGLHAGQEMLLMHLWEQDGQTQSQLAEKMGVQLPTVHKMLARLEATNLIKRGSTAEDGRISLIYLTEQSFAMREAVSESWNKLDAKSTANMTVEERMLLRRLLLQVQVNLSSG